jgi:ankyrin repeat protein
MLDQGADANARDARGDTALMLAAVYGGTDSMRLLLDRGADVNATNNSGATALMRAAANDAKVRLLLRRGADVHARSSFGNTALLLAARPANSHATVKRLLEYGADARTTNIFGGSTLMAAAAGDDAETVKLLLRHGADSSAQPCPDENGFLFGGGRTPLMWAAFRGNTKIMRMLIDAGADVNTSNGLGTALAQAAWADKTEAARLLIENGARCDIAGLRDGYLPLHWAASTEREDASLVRLLLEHGADPNAGGGEEIDAFMGTPQTPLMLARRRGETGILTALQAAGATNARPERVAVITARRELPAQLDEDLLRLAVNRALGPLQTTAIESKQSFLNHASRQDCTSCHQQHLPMTAMGLARKINAQVDGHAEQTLIDMVRQGEIKEPEFDWLPLFHPDPAQTKGYELLAYAGEDLPADANSDAWVHHLSAIQGSDGRWYNNLPRPPLQTGDIGATALAIHALHRYPLPGRQAEAGERIARARKWLRSVTAEDTDSMVYQLLGLAWAGESCDQLQSLAHGLIAQQRADGGWAQLPGLKSDAYATGQAVYALRVAAGMRTTEPSVDRGLRYLLAHQLDDGTWHVRRRAFPFQPTMDSRFPHGRDGWISSAATSWAVMALSVASGDMTRMAALEAGDRVTRSHAALP